MASMIRSLQHTVSAYLISDTILQSVQFREISTGDSILASYAKSRCFFPVDL